MGFATLLYHEIRKRDEFHPEKPYSIDVKQEYEDQLPAPLFITLDQFEEQMEFLYRENFHTLTLAEVRDYFYRGKNIPEKSVLITFDDCFQSMKQYAYPVLKKYGFHAVAFVVTGWLHDEPKEYNPEKCVCLAKEELDEMADVFEYANHTDSFHQRYDVKTGRMMVEKDERFARDLDECNRHVPVKDVFAYPFGLFHERNVELLRKKWFTLAFTTKTGKNDRQTDPLLLKRNIIPFTLELEQFQKIVLG